MGLRGGVPVSHCLAFSLTEDVGEKRMPFSMSGRLESDWVDLRLGDTDLSYYTVALEKLKEDSPVPDVTASGVVGAVPILFPCDWGIRAALAVWVVIAWGACVLSCWQASWTFPVSKSLSSLEVDASVGVETSIEASTSGGGCHLSAFDLLADGVLGD